MATLEELKSFYREQGTWVVSTQEVLCCQKLHGGQDKMIEKMHKEDIFFYIYDATIGPIDRPRISYIDRLHMFSTGRLRKNRYWVMLEPEIPIPAGWRSVHFAPPDDVRPLFADPDLVIDYIPPAMPDFVGPMPRIELREGKYYYPFEICLDKLRDGFQQLQEKFGSIPFEMTESIRLVARSAIAEVQTDQEKRRPKGPRRSKYQRGQWWNK